MNGEKLQNAYPTPVPVGAEMGMQQVMANMLSYPYHFQNVLLAVPAVNGFHPMMATQNGLLPFNTNMGNYGLMYYPNVTVQASNMAIASHANAGEQGALTATVSSHKMKSDSSVNISSNEQEKLSGDNSNGTEGCSLNVLTEGKTSVNIFNDDGKHNAAVQKNENDRHSKMEIRIDKQIEKSCVREEANLLLQLSSSGSSPVKAINAEKHNISSISRSTPRNISSMCQLKPRLDVVNENDVQTSPGVRENMAQLIHALLLAAINKTAFRHKTKPQNIMKCLPALAQSIEALLYRKAPSDKAYQDVSTLKRRMVIISRCVKRAGMEKEKCKQKEKEKMNLNLLRLIRKPWHDQQGDKYLRGDILKQCIWTLEKIFPGKGRINILKLAMAVEHVLYCTATSQSEYVNVTSFKNRVILVLKRIIAAQRKLKTNTQYGPVQAVAKMNKSILSEPAFQAVAKMSKSILSEKAAEAVAKKNKSILSEKVVAMICNLNKEAAIHENVCKSSCSSNSNKKESSEVEIASKKSIVKETNISVTSHNIEPPKHKRARSNGKKRAPKRIKVTLNWKNDVLKYDYLNKPLFALET